MAKTVLLVDDDTLMRKGLGSGLASAGYTVEEANNGKEGLAKALEIHPHLIVADVRMPEMDGLTMIEQLRKDDWGKTATVIVMSTDDTTPSVNQAMIAGVTVYLSKSTLTPDILLQEVSDAIGR